MPLPELLTPELALVSPDLAARARAALPERPWELFAPPVSPPVSPPETAPAIRTPQPADPPGVDGIPVAARERPPTPNTPVSSRAEPRRHSARRRARKALVPVLIVTLALTAVTWASERTPVPSVGAGPDDALPRSGGYVFAGGTLRLTPDGRGVYAITFYSGCAAGGSARRIPVGDRRFSFHGPLAGVGSVNADVSGQFLDRRYARLEIALRGKGCPAGSVERVASLS